MHCPTFRDGSQMSRLTGIQGKMPARKSFGCSVHFNRGVFVRGAGRHITRSRIDREGRSYIITVRRIISGEAPNWRHGFGLAILGSDELTETGSGQFALTLSHR